MDLLLDPLFNEGLSSNLPRRKGLLRIACQVARQSPYPLLTANQDLQSHLRLRPGLIRCCHPKEERLLLKKHRSIKLLCGDKH